MKAKLNWRTYEKEILNYFQETYPGTTIEFDKRIVGRYSKIERQIDISIEGEIAGYPIRIVVDCKFFGKKIDVKIVEAFSSMVDDVDAHQGVLITHNGYSQAAINRAYYGQNKIELDIINFNSLKLFQGLHAFPYSGHFLILLPAPFGWIIDLKEKINSFPAVFQRGISFKEAQKKMEWMYFDIFKIPSSNFRIDDVIANQNHNILEVYPTITFSYKIYSRSDNFPTKLRIANFESAPNPYFEVTGFVQFEDYIFIIYLITPKELLNKNQRKLEHILVTVKQGRINFENSLVIDQLLKRIQSSEDPKEKAEMHHQIGIWYKEMDDYQNSLVHFRKTVTYIPNHYGYLKQLIFEELINQNLDECLKYCSQLFGMEPKNPQVLNDLMIIFFRENKIDQLINFFQITIKSYSENEVLGNLYFHLGKFLLSVDREKDGFKNLIKGEEYFKKVFPSTHYVFKEIAKIKDG
jgi:tetratricopeptide (TPR) repeat protein